MLNTQLQDVISLGPFQILNRTAFKILEDIHLTLLLGFSLVFFEQRDIRFLCLHGAAVTVQCSMVFANCFNIAII